MNVLIQKGNFLDVWNQWVNKVLTDLQSTGSYYAIHLVSAVPRSISEDQRLVSGYFVWLGRVLDGSWISICSIKMIWTISGVSTTVCPGLFSFCIFIPPIKWEKSLNFSFPCNKAFPNFVLLYLKSTQMIREVTLKQRETASAVR